MTDWQYVDQAPGLDDLIARIRPAARIALDTEADSFHHFHEKICLLQFNVDGAFFLLDPLAGLDLQPLFDLLIDRELLLHGADYDLRMLRTCHQFQPRGRVVDTTIAAQLLGIRAFGLASLVEQFFGVKVSKDDQRSDWSRRPLSDTQLAYAVDDVRYLPELASRLEAQLEEKGRLGWFHESCAAQVAAAAIDRPRDPDREWRIKGAHSCSRRELAFLRSLWYWRQEEASVIDRPPFMILPNGPLVKLAVLAAGDSRGNGIPARFELPRNLRDNNRHGRLVEAIRQARELTSADYPEIPRSDGKRWPRQDEETLRVLRHAVGKLADTLDLEAPVIAPRAALGAIIEHRAGTPEQIMEVGSLQRWQAELVQPLVAEVL